jgi:hypothetical protein
VAPSSRTLLPGISDYQAVPLQLWHTELEKAFEWLKVDRRRMMIAIIPPDPPKFRLSELSYKEAIARCLNDKGFDCRVDVN